MLSKPKFANHNASMGFRIFAAYHMKKTQKKPKMESLKV